MDIFHFELDEAQVAGGTGGTGYAFEGHRSRTDSDDVLLSSSPQFEIDEDLYMEADIPGGSETEDDDSTEEIRIDDMAFEEDGEPSSQKVSPRDFEIVSLVGKGAYGKVFLVRKVTGKDAGQLFAMKVLRKASLIVRKKDVEHTRAERTILERIRHAFIVNLVYAFQTDNKLYLILEFASGGEVFTYMASEGMFMEDTARFYLAEIVLAIEHVHSIGIIYRDLKPENILLGRDGHVLLTDFGLSKVALDEPDGRTGTCCGTVEYMAPETLANHRYGMAVDWWSLGAVMYDMLAGQPPFTSNNRKTTMEKIMNGKLKLPNYFTPDAKDLVRKLLRKTPAVRLGANGANDVKCHPFFKSINWQQLAQRQLTPPIKPILTSEVDVSNFDKQFTSMAPVDSPADPVMLTDSFRDVFKGFSYMAPSVLLAATSISPGQRHALGLSPRKNGTALLAASPIGRHRPPRTSDPIMSDI